MMVVKIKWGAAYVMPRLEIPHSLADGKCHGPVNTHIHAAALRKRNITVPFEVANCALPDPVSYSILLRGNHYLDFILAISLL